jgi:TubC N-terminal docking domain
VCGSEVKADEVLAILKEEGITLSVDGEDLIARPTPAVTPELVALIREHKASLASELRPIRCEAEVFELARKHFGIS